MLFRSLLAIFAAVCMSAAAHAAPLEAYGRLPTIEDVAISPDGETLAFIYTNGEQRRVVIQKADEEKPAQIFDVGDVKLRTVTWASAQHLLLIKTDTSRPMEMLGPRREWAMAFVLDMATLKVRPLMKDVPKAMNVVYGEPMIRTVEGRPVVFLQGQYFPTHHGRMALFRVDLEKLTTKLVDAEAQDSNDWAVDAGGEVLARSEYDGREGRWRLRVKTAQGWKLLNAHDAPLERPDLSGLGRDGGSALIRQIEDGQPVLREIQRGATAWGDPLPVEAYGRLLKDPATHTLIGSYALIGDESRYTFFDARDQKVWKAIQAAYPGERVDLASWSADRKRIVVRVDSPTDGPAYALVDLGTRKANWLGQEFVGIGPDDISPVRPVKFKARDGMELSGYLTLPRGRQARNLPVVVFPHGGPASRDAPGFDWWAQAMASRGYAVLQVNFRGSDGFGWEFLKAGFGQWGRKMQGDLSDGLRHVVSQGVVDPKRACIVGASYGGYAALAGVTLEQGVYRCAASVAGPSDLPRMIAWSRQQGGYGAQRYWLRFMGAENVRDDVLDAISPAALAQRAEAPILLVHGRDDTVVPLDQSRRMADALERAGRPVELVVLPGDDHWLSRGATRLRMLQSVITFLERHNPPS